MSEFIVSVPDEAAEYFIARFGLDGTRMMGYDLTGEIVRCRDCEHGIKADLSGNWYECMKPDGNGDYARWDVEPDGYCAWAERRDAE